MELRRNISRPSQALPLIWTRFGGELSEAKEKAGRLPPGLLNNLTDLISTANSALGGTGQQTAEDAVSEVSDASTAANSALGGTDQQTAEDAVTEVSDAIDGAYQDFFLQNLRVIVRAEGDMSADVTSSLDRVKLLVGRREWSDAMTAFDQFKELLAASKPTTPSPKSAPVAPPLPKEAVAKVRDKTWELLGDADISTDLVRSAANRIAQTGTIEDAENFLGELAEAMKNIGTVTDEPELIDLTEEQMDLLSATQTWQGTVDRLFRMMLNLAQTLRDDGDEDSAAVGNEIESMLRDFPPALGAFLPSLEKAVRTGNMSAVQTLSKLVKNEVKLCSEYLTSNQTYLVACENNPFDVEVEIESPLKSALKTILTCLQPLPAATT